MALSRTQALLIDDDVRLGALLREYLGKQEIDVTVVEIVEEPSNPAGALSRVRDVVAWLSRHGVRASELVPDQRGGAALQLERIASELGAAVIVAGAYGHSRFREWVLGGVTRHLVTQSSRCSFLAH